MPRQSLLVFSLVTLMILMGCADEPQLTAPTITGEETLSCLVDSEVWIPRVHIVSLIPSKSIIFADSSLIVEARNEVDVKDGNSESLLLECYRNIATGELSVTGGRFTRGTTPYEQLVPGSAYMRVTALDTVKKIIAGRFQFKARSMKGKVIDITDGRFDVHYQRY